MPHTPQNFVANGNIFPATFVKIDPTDSPQGSGGFKCVAAGAAAAPIGIAQAGSNYPPVNDPALTVGDATYGPYAAVAGQSIRVYGEGEVCLVRLAAACVPGDYLKPVDAVSGPPAYPVGSATPVVATGSTGARQPYGARAIQGGSAGELVQCVVECGVFPQTLT